MRRTARVVAAQAARTASSGLRFHREAEPMLPPDVDPQSRCRLPLVRREDLDAEGREAYDRHVDPKGGTLRGLRGPGGIGLHSPGFSRASRAVLGHLRGGTELSERVREIAVLTVARELDNAFEWAAHAPQAAHAGVPAATIAAIRDRLPLEALDPLDALVIQLGREALGARRVSAQTYASALQRFGSRGLVDLAGLMGHYSAAAVLLTVFDMQLDDDEPHRLPMP